MQEDTNTMAADPFRPGPALRAALLALPLLGACTTIPDQPANGWASLPSDAVVGAGDPVRAAILNTAYVFPNPGSVAGKPDMAARAVANYEFLTTEIPYGPRWRGFNPTVGVELLAGQQEVAQAFGIAPNAPTQQVVDALYAASRALRAGDQAAAERVLSGPAFTRGGAATLQTLASMPSMPRAAAAAALTAQELDRNDRLGSPRGVGGDGGGGGGYR
ncbi:hypothetical protein [Paracraurococcus ruber]|uniref:Uncharacterized protein n=1 Tax=Paracraurococcus ruber TaxID=77675 RepID=A0ABS1D0Q3_9PROT|nr:hypothetical protein [Paracraurococcus ruber]MBK1660368.1 hypothetical protein [Paracraurococcus ruber]TDG31861.1 hypothetical protein E2C05_09390 [Paracraurococcus ruber]